MWLLVRESSGEDEGMRRKGWGLLLIIGLWTTPAWAKLEISPSFLGMYRKTMVIERELATYVARHGVDLRLARAVLIQESGGNDKLVSSAGAGGYFQVMPGTFRLLGVRSNIEAGIKYLGQMKRRFGREDYAVAAYNAGPGRIGDSRPLPLETLQYVIGVGHYKSVLRLHETEIARQAAMVQLTRVHKGDSWETLAQQTGIQAPVLRFYNPFLATRSLQTGAIIAYPQSAPSPLLELGENQIYYTSRIGDSYLNLAFVFGVDLETFRRDNDLWRLQQLPPGVRLQLRLPSDSPFRALAAPVVANPLPQQLVKTFIPSPDLKMDTLKNQAAEETVKSAKTKKKAGVMTRTKHKRGKTSGKVQHEKNKSRRVHQVRRGETLEKIARRYGTSVRSLRFANDLRNSRIQAGVVLQVPNS